MRRILGSRDGRHRVSIGRVMGVAGVLSLTLGVLGVSEPPAWAAPSISAVQFTGDTTSNTITITGSGFGSTPPAGSSDNVTGCGTYTNNGEDYGTNLFFQTSTFEAGAGTPPSGSCVGLIVDSWSDGQVVLTFGNAYNTFGGWDIATGDGFTMNVEGATFNGSVAFNGSSTTSSCAANDSCTAVAGSPNEDVVATGTSSTTGTMTVSQAQAVLDCGPAYDHVAPINTLSETNFTSSSPITVVDVVGQLPSAKGVKVCFQPLGATPPAPRFLTKCKTVAVAPCYRSIHEVDGSAVATLLVPANDPRFWTDGGTPTLTTFTPSAGVVGAEVTVKGKHMSEVQTVLFGSTSATITKRTTKAVTVHVPDGATSGPITVVSSAGQAVSSQSFTVEN